MPIQASQQDLQPQPLDYSMSRKQRYVAESKKTGTFLNNMTLKNSAQEAYADLLRESTITFCRGPAGTGKTYIAAYYALQALLNDEVRRVILTRPIVAVEDIGYLPGDMLEKIHPYILPLLDAIEDHVGPTKARELLNLGSIEIVPLAYMRGRSINEAFVILDEAQNTTPEQMKMFLTRIGYGSKMVITGDSSQSDLQVPLNGLQWASDRLKGTNSQVSVVEFAPSNIVRNPLIESMLAHLDSPPAKQSQSRVTEGPGRLINMNQGAGRLLSSPTARPQ